MIAGTEYSPSKAFIEFARNFFESLAVDDFQGALGQLDKSEKSWSKSSISGDLKKVLNGRWVCSAKSFRKSASPELEVGLNEYMLRHRIPCEGKWSDAKVNFCFRQKEGTGYYYVYLIGFEH